MVILRSVRFASTPSIHENTNWARCSRIHQKPIYCSSMSSTRHTYWHRTRFTNVSIWHCETRYLMTFMQGILKTSQCILLISNCLICHFPGVYLFSHYFVILCKILDQIGRECQSAPAQCELRGCVRTVSGDWLAAVFGQVPLIGRWSSRPQLWLAGLMMTRAGRAAEKRLEHLCRLTWWQSCLGWCRFRLINLSGGSCCEERV